MKASRVSLGGLNCHLVHHGSDGPAPEMAVVLCHGYGAPGTDLVPIGEEVLRGEQSLGSRVLFAFPEAPLQPDELGPFGGRAWWNLDMERLVMAAQTGEWDRLKTEEPEGLAEARNALGDLIAELGAQLNLPVSRIVLGGFSQGAMLATDVALHLDESPAALCAFSGALICEERWTENAPKRSGLTVIQSHGRQDPLLPFFGAEMLRRLLDEAGLSVDFIPFDGPHTIPLEGIERLSRLLVDLLG